MSARDAQVVLGQVTAIEGTAGTLAEQEAKALTRIAEDRERDDVLGRRGDFLSRRFFSHEAGCVASRSGSFEAKGKR